METLRVTQDEQDDFSHKGSFAIDFGGEDTGKSNIYAPCNLKITRVRRNANGEIYWTSTEPILFADGSIDYASGVFLHCDNRHLVEGMFFLQDDYITQEGGWGAGSPNKFGNHVHVEACKGILKQPRQVKNGAGIWVIEKQNSLRSMFFIPKNVKILKAGKAHWVIDHETEIVEQKCLECKYFIERNSK